MNNKTSSTSGSCRVLLATGPLVPLLLLLSLFLPTAVYGEEAADELTYRAGAASIDVTPPAIGTSLALRPARSTGVAEPLFARALVLEGDSPASGSQDNNSAKGKKVRVAIITNDFCGFDLPFNDRLLKAISAATGIPPSHIMINCSHNHSAPFIGDWAPPADVGPQPWHDELVEKFVTVTKQAADSLRPARLRIHREPTQLGMNRRLKHNGDVIMSTNPHGSNLPWTDVLSVEVPKVERVAVLFTYGAHPVIVQRASTLIGGDYPGYTIKRLEAMAKAGGTGGVFMFGQGASGDINAFPLAGGMQAADIAGRDLSYAVLRAIRAPGHVLKSNDLRVAATEVQLPLQDPPPVDQIKSRIAYTKDEKRKRWLEGLLAMAENPDKESPAKSLRYPISAFAFGNELCIVALPHETFSYYTHFTETVSPFANNLVLGYTNGVNGYVATKRDYLLGAAGGYEASPLGSAINYTTRLAPNPESQAIIEQGIRTVLDQVDGQKK